MGAVAAAVLLLLACLTPGAPGGRFYCATLNVTNGETAGKWGPREFCQAGYAIGFAVKVSDATWLEASPGSLWGGGKFCLVPAP